MTLKEKVQKAIAKVRPALQRDGGDIQMVKILEDEKAVVVRLTGACHGCPMSTQTIKGFVEQTIQREVPEITEVRLAN